MQFPHVNRAAGIGLATCLLLVPLSGCGAAGRGLGRAISSQGARSAVTTAPKFTPLIHAPDALKPATSLRLYHPGGQVPGLLHPERLPLVTHLESEIPGGVGAGARRAPAQAAKESGGNEWLTEIGRHSVPTGFKHFGQRDKEESNKQPGGLPERR